MNESKSAPFRPVNIASWDVCVEHSPDGSIYMRPVQKLADYPTKLTDRLDEWAVREPSRVFLAQRNNEGNVAHANLRRIPRFGSRDRAGPARSWSFRRTPGRSSFRKRYRARANWNGCDVCGHSVRAHLACLFSRLVGLRKVVARVSSSDARPGIRRGRRDISARDRSRHAVGRHARRDNESHLEGRAAEFVLGSRRNARYGSCRSKLIGA